MFNLKYYFKYVDKSIYKIEVYLINDTICFIIYLLIYIYYAIKKYSNRVQLNDLESFESRFYMRFYDLNDVDQKSLQKFIEQRFVNRTKIIRREEPSRNHQEIKIMKMLQFAEKNYYKINNQQDWNAICTHIFHKE
ncbi:unnamed protein product [Paramecium primaurelia]|uniref:Uncharacterized protein n=1 Tax=Paramecium primaurelia TaxID=5886 RepID=A0A8S1P258_PARPR|nr:unnamed protein product [Paramecium primaurelia]